VTAVWITIAVLAVGTAASKVAGTLVLGTRPPGELMLSVTGLVAPALLAALVVYETLSGDDGITLDARAAGVGAAAVAILLRAPMLVVMLVAAAVTAGLRAFS
jgi:hypothetical protein